MKISEGGGPRGGGYPDIFIRRLRPFVWFKILNFNIFCFFRKMNIFGGILFLGHHKIGLYLGVIFRSFLRSRYRIGEFFLGVLEVPDIFVG